MHRPKHLNNCSIILNAKFNKTRHLNCKFSSFVLLFKENRMKKKNEDLNGDFQSLTEPYHNENEETKKNR